MDEEKINEIYELVKENNKLLKAEKRLRTISRILRIIWVIIVVAVPVWVYYTYIAPTIGSLQENLATLQALSQKSPALQEQLTPIIEATKTIMNMFGIK